MIVPLIILLSGIAVGFVAGYGIRDYKAWNAELDEHLENHVP
jgi:hypothetical protein